jgi:lipopolysaccharide transport system ATP-binding protein
MSKTVIQINNLGKQYRLGQVGTTTIANDFKRFMYRLRGKEDPFLKIGEENDRTKKGSSDYVWALKDINFSVNQGDVLGIIGKNGAGKSTLLKILSRTTAPTLGEYKIKGRVASLLEVGTGFHPDLTGRENVFLNGAILGMTKSEIKKQFDAIVDFSGVERYIDTPVKRYSSGMYVRLAFAVAAHLEPEILIVDEVLAVGDAEFRKKCMGKMSEVSKIGRTILFVSHELSAISGICNKGILLANGKLIHQGKIDEVIHQYQKVVVNNVTAKHFNSERIGDSTIQLHALRLLNKNEQESFTFHINEKIGVEISYTLFKLESCVNLCVAVYTVSGQLVFMSFPKKEEVIKQSGTHNVICWIPKHFLNNEVYALRVNAHSFYPTQAHFDLENVLNFEITEPEKDISIYYEDKISGVVRANCIWQKK